MRRCRWMAVCGLVIAACGGTSSNGEAGDDTSGPSAAEPTTTVEMTTTVEADEPVTTVEATDTSEAGPTADDHGIEASGDTTTAQRLVDDLYTALVRTDPQAAASLFTEDGVFVDKNGTPRVGSAAIARYVELVGPGITHCQRTGAIEVVGDGSYEFPVEFTYSGTDYTQEVALTTENDLIVFHEWKTVR